MTVVLFSTLLRIEPRNLFNCLTGKKIICYNEYNIKNLLYEKEKNYD